MNRESKLEKSINWKSVIWTALIASLLTAGTTALISKLTNCHEGHKTHQFHADKGNLYENGDTLKGILSKVFNTGDFVFYRDKSRKKIPVHIFKDVIARGDNEPSLYNIVKEVKLGTVTNGKKEFWQGDRLVTVVVSEELMEMVKCTTTGQLACIPVTPFAYEQSIINQDGNDYYPVIIYTHTGIQKIELGFVELNNGEMDPFVNRLNASGCQNINVPATLGSVTFDGLSYPMLTYDPLDPQFWLNSH